MALRVAIQMDHIRSIDVDADSTFVLALEAQSRGHGLYHYLPEQLTFDRGRVLARAELLREKGMLHALLDNVKDAIQALEEYLLRTEGAGARYNTSILLQELLARLN